VVEYFWIRVSFDPMFTLCKYVLETGRCYSIKKKSDKKKAKSTVTWYGSNAMVPLKKTIRRCRCTIIPG